MFDRRVIVIAPVYNEGRSVYNLLNTFAEMFRKTGIPHLVIPINDCSRDDSQAWIDRALSENPDLVAKPVRHEVNKGLHGALNTALELLRDEVRDDDVVVTLDGDNTHNPKLIPRMLGVIEEGADIVIASRYCEGSRISGLTRFRILLSTGARFLYQAIWRIPGVRDYTCLFRVYRGAAIRKLLARRPAPVLEEQGFTAVTELLARLANDGPVITEVPMILRYEAKENASNMRLLRTIRQTLRIMVYKFE